MHWPATGDPAPEISEGTCSGGLAVPRQVETPDRDLKKNVKQYFIMLLHLFRSKIIILKNFTISLCRMACDMKTAAAGRGSSTPALTACGGISGMPPPPRCASAAALCLIRLGLKAALSASQCGAERSWQWRQVRPWRQRPRRYHDRSSQNQTGQSMAGLRAAR